MRKTLNTFVSDHYLYISLFIFQYCWRLVGGRQSVEDITLAQFASVQVPTPLFLFWGHKLQPCEAATTPASDPHDLLTFCEASRKGRSSTAWARRQRCPSAIGKPRRSWARGCLERCSWARMRVAGRLGVGAIGAIGAVGAVGAVAGAGKWMPSSAIKTWQMMADDGRWGIELEMSCWAAVGCLAGGHQDFEIWRFC